MRAHEARLRRLCAEEREVRRPGRRPTFETLMREPGVIEVLRVPEGVAVRFAPDTDSEAMRRVARW